MGVFTQEIENETEFTDVLALVHRWRDLAGQQGGLPRLADFGHLLGGRARENLCVLKRAGSDFRYQSAGAAVADCLGGDPVGGLMSDLAGSPEPMLVPHGLRALRDGVPWFSAIESNALGVPGVVEWLGLPVLLPDGSPGLLGFLRPRANRYDLIRSLFDASQNGVIAVSPLRDADGIAVDLKIDAVNAVGADMLAGRGDAGSDNRPGGLIGASLRSCLPAPAWAELWPHLKTGLIRGERVVFDIAAPVAGVSARYRVCATPLKQGLSLVIADQSELLHALQTLETQHATLVKVNAELRSEVVRRRRLELELKKEAASDPLTGIANRRGFVDAVLVCLAAPKPGHGDPALIMFDIDDFKAINDRYGHPAGDQVLKTIARAIGRELGSGALFGRIGGEEFAVFLPHTTKDGAQALAEHLRQVIAGLACRPVRAKVRVTASFGVAASLEADSGFDDLIARADEALYKAKRGGRNCVQYDIASFGSLAAVGLEAR